MTSQIDIEQYINTSREAYNNFVQSFLGELYKNILNALKIRPMSAPEINNLIGDDLDNVMSRLSELKAAGVIEVTGEYYRIELLTRSGKKKIQPYRIYRITENTFLTTDKTNPNG